MRPRDDKVSNFPMVDNRVIEFAEKLEEFIYSEAIDLPVISVIGALETVKMVILHESTD